MEESLAEFIKGAWDVLEPGNPLVWNWHLDTICGYLEAVARGDIVRIIFNIPPGTMKSLTVNVFYPAWVWTRDPSHKFLCGSNEARLATRDSLKMRMLVQSQWYRSRWGVTVDQVEREYVDHVILGRDQSEKTHFANTKLGHRESQGVLARVTGKRGDSVIWDDPHDAVQTESDIQREAVTNSWDTGWATRVNNLAKSPRILIMQRLHLGDATAHFLGKKNQQWVLVVIPMRYDPDLTYDAGADIGRPELNDPRTEEGDLMFPELFPEDAVQQLENDLKPYGTAGQLQQRPSPKGGGEFRREWLNHYKMAPRGGNRYILVDPAGEKRQGNVRKKRDNTAMGVFEFCADGNKYLIDGVRDRLNLTERTDLLFKWHRKYNEMRPGSPKVLNVGYEEYGMQSDIAHIKDVMEREGYRFKIQKLGGSLKKEDRIRRLIPLFEGGTLWLPESLNKVIWDGTTIDLIHAFVEKEYLPFPVAEWDDFFDMMSRIEDPEFKMVPPKKRPVINVRKRVMTDTSIGY